MINSIGWMINPLNTSKVLYPKEKEIIIYMIESLIPSFLRKIFLSANRRKAIIIMLTTNINH